MTVAEHLVGRADELDSFDHLLAALDAGRAAMAVEVVGEPGSEKHGFHGACGPRGAHGAISCSPGRLRSWNAISPLGCSLMRFDEQPKGEIAFQLRSRPGSTRWPRALRAARKLREKSRSSRSLARRRPRRPSRRARRRARQGGDRTSRARALILRGARQRSIVRTRTDKEGLKNRKSGCHPDVVAAFASQSRHMPCYVLHHRHEPHE